VHKLSFVDFPVMFSVTHEVYKRPTADKTNKRSVSYKQTGFLR